ncbi:hypothetical protein ACFL0Q_07960, partial [Thermodesulfobacteriota bacterium]
TKNIRQQNSGKRYFLKMQVSLKFAILTDNANILESVDTESTVAASFSRQPSDVAVKKFPLDLILTEEMIRYVFETDTFLGFCLKGAE